jgi:hypothetical protein
MVACPSLHACFECALLPSWCFRCIVEIFSLFPHTHSLSLTYTCTHLSNGIPAHISTSSLSAFMHPQDGSPCCTSGGAVDARRSSACCLPGSLAVYRMRSHARGAGFGFGMWFAEHVLLALVYGIPSRFDPTQRPNAGCVITDKRLGRYECNALLPKSSSGQCSSPGGYTYNLFRMQHSHRVSISTRMGG